MRVLLFVTQEGRVSPVKAFTLNSDGRSDGPLYDNKSLKKGTYRLVFDMKACFQAQGVSLPLRVSTWGDATYRGS